MCTQHAAHMLHRHAWVRRSDAVCGMCHRLYVSSLLHSFDRESHCCAPAPSFLINSSYLDVDPFLLSQGNKCPSTGQIKRGEEKDGAWKERREAGRRKDGVAVKSWRKVKRTWEANVMRWVKSQQGGGRRIKRLAVGWMISPCLQGYSVQLYHGGAGQWGWLRGGRMGACGWVTWTVHHTRLN